MLSLNSSQYFYSYLFQASLPASWFLLTDCYVSISLCLCKHDKHDQRDPTHLLCFNSVSLNSQLHFQTEANSESSLLAMGNLGIVFSLLLLF